ncbi:hypothetical protein DIPPA_19252 [Diplonema papillatum]|nr:hypothetical protein DIPPA_19252 [Diplonema papillatum]
MTGSQYFKRRSERMWEATQRAIELGVADGNEPRRAAWGDEPCSVCNKCGHHVTDCWYAMVTRQVCFNCGAEGHVVRNCPAAARGAAQPSSRGAGRTWTDFIAPWKGRGGKGGWPSAKGHKDTWSNPPAGHAAPSKPQKKAGPKKPQYPLGRGQAAWLQAVDPSSYNRYPSKGRKGGKGSEVAGRAKASLWKPEKAAVQPLPAGAPTQGKGRSEKRRLHRQQEAARRDDEDRNRPSASPAEMAAEERVPLLSEGGHQPLEGTNESFVQPAESVRKEEATEPLARPSVSSVPELSQPTRDQANVSRIHSSISSIPEENQPNKRANESPSAQQSEPSPTRREVSFSRPSLSMQTASSASSSSTHKPAPTISHSPHSTTHVAAPSTLASPTGEVYEIISQLSPSTSTSESDSYEHIATTELQ